MTCETLHEMTLPSLTSSGPLVHCIKPTDLVAPEQLSCFLSHGLCTCSLCLGPSFSLYLQGWLLLHPAGVQLRYQFLTTLFK